MVASRILEYICQEYFRYCLIKYINSKHEMIIIIKHEIKLEKNAVFILQ